MRKNRIKKVSLTRLQRLKILNLYVRGLISKSEIYRQYGWTIDELSLNKPVSEEHYLIKCPKCHSNSVVMSRHYTNIGISGVSVVCRDCGTNAFARDYMSAMVKWNREEVSFTH